MATDNKVFHGRTGAESTYCFVVTNFCSIIITLRNLIRFFIRCCCLCRIFFFFLFSLNPVARDNARAQRLGPMCVDEWQIFLRVANCMRACVSVYGNNLEHMGT